MTRASHHIFKGEPSHPKEKTHFGRLYPRSYSFGRYPKLVTIGEADADRPVKTSPLHHNRLVQRPHHCRWHTDPVELPTSIYQPPLETFQKEKQLPGQSSTLSKPPVLVTVERKNFPLIRKLKQNQTQCGQPSAATTWEGGEERRDGEMVR